MPVNGTSTGVAPMGTLVSGWPSRQQHLRATTPTSDFPYGCCLCPHLTSCELLPLCVIAPCGLAMGYCLDLSQPGCPLQGALETANHPYKNITCRWLPLVRRQRYHCCQSLQ
ncbi:hypothetical protein B296_00043484 [Ensete ventricosum]|uniref:Uncharacterized protein n=1 Tax=Ensete ventricosum TaxID=4639 RepID=A0A426ZEB0_ENSVE|nr:hypothetical protein B296_00043484 [Ensete ventricosum]